MHRLSSESIVSGITALVVLVVYVLTAYPGVSFWDCGEWILSAHSLQVPHAPGAPLYSLIGRLFAMAGSSEGNSVAYRIVLLSSISGAACIFFFSRLTIQISEYILRHPGIGLKQDSGLSLMSGGLGGLLLGFSDSFWRNCTEAEVYSLTACFFAATLYFGWRYFVEGNTRYFLLSCFLIGAGLCVHPTQILVLPLIIGIHLFRQYPVLVKQIAKGILIWLILSLILGYWLTEGLVFVGLQMDLILAGHSGMGLPPGYGLLLVWLLSLFGFLIIFCLSNKKISHWLGLGLLHAGLAFYCLIPLRTDSPMQLGAGKDAGSFYSYFTRAEFGKPPGIYGPSYMQNTRPSVQSSWYWDAIRNHYARIKKKEKKVEDPQGWFPRMYSSAHAEAYNQWRLDQGYTIETPPTWKENLWFFLSEQSVHYFVRYLGWNFIGRTNDSPESQVLSVNSFEDFFSFGNKRRVNYHFLPLLLLILGIPSVFFFTQKVPLFWIIGFLITGPLLVWVLNMTPDQVRERDYVFQLCMVFCFLLAALSPISLCYGLNSGAKNTMRFLSALLFITPAIQLIEGWSSHDNSKNYSALNFSEILLASCPSQSVLITAGDNDTFPLWCTQQVYGFRPDVTILNLNLLHQPWYYRRLEMPGQIGQFQLKHPLPDSLDYKPILHVEGSAMERMDSLLRSKNWSAPLVWTRYEFILASILTDMGKFEPNRSVVFSPLLPTQKILYMRAETRLNGIGRELSFNTDTALQTHPAEHFKSILTLSGKWNPENLNHIERSFHKLIRKKGIMHAATLENRDAIIRYLTWLDQSAPPDKPAGVIPQNLAYARLLDSCGQTKQMTEFLASLSLQAVERAKVSAFPEDYCREIEEIESMIRLQHPRFKFSESWFNQDPAYPCAGH